MCDQVEHLFYFFENNLYFIISFTVCFSSILNCINIFVCNYLFHMYMQHSALSYFKEKLYINIWYYYYFGKLSREYLVSSLPIFRTPKWEDDNFVKNNQSKYEFSFGLWKCSFCMIGLQINKSTFLNLRRKVPGYWHQ